MAAGRGDQQAERHHLVVERLAGNAEKAGGLGAAEALRRSPIEDPFALVGKAAAGRRAAWLGRGPSRRAGSVRRRRRAGALERAGKLARIARPVMAEQHAIGGGSSSAGFLPKVSVSRLCKTICGRSSRRILSGVRSILRAARPSSRRASKRSGARAGSNRVIATRRHRGAGIRRRRGGGSRRFRRPHRAGAGWRGRARRGHRARGWNRGEFEPAEAAANHAGCRAGFAAEQLDIHPLMSGGAQLSQVKRRALRAPPECSARARSRRPVPGSPVIRQGRSVARACSKAVRARTEAGAAPTRPTGVRADRDGVRAG